MEIEVNTLENSILKNPKKHGGRTKCLKTLLNQNEWFVRATFPT